MRDVTMLGPDDPIPDQGEIPDPDRYRPEAVLVRAVRWRVLDDDYLEVERADGRSERIHPMFGPVLRGLEAGEPFDVYAARAADVTPRYTAGINAKATASYARRFLLQLWERGHVDIPFAPPPDVFVQRYRRIRELGRGGVGIVHLCEDLAAEGRLVTVKHAWGFRQEIQRTDRELRKESRMLQAMAHPNVIRYLGGWEEGGVLHTVREYAPGALLKPSLRDLPGMERGALRRRVMREIAATVRDLHAAGFLLLDISPGNFLLHEERNGPVLIDVGLSRRHEAGSVAIHYPIGSAGYASPEVIKRIGATRRSDVFSFGRLYFTLLSPRVPGKHEETAPLVAELRAAGVAEDEVRVVERCAAMDPSERPASMDEVLRLMEAG